MTSTTQTDLQLYIPDISDFEKSIATHLTEMASVFTLFRPISAADIGGRSYTTKVRGKPSRSYIDSVTTNFSGVKFVVTALAHPGLSGYGESYRYTVRQLGNRHWQIDEEVEIVLD